MMKTKTKLKLKK